MHNITIVGSIHTEKGKCNSEELYKIIDQINPEIIFEELSIIISDLFYKEKCNYDEYYKILKYNLANNIVDLIGILPSSEIPLEVNCIRKYLQNHNILNIPVDIVTDPETSESFGMMLYEFYKHDDIYKKLVDECELSIEYLGFEFLNSKDYLNKVEKIKLREKQLIDSNVYFKDELLNIYDLFSKEIIDDRENEMLLNIYNFSKENVYNQAVFLIGARHTKSIMERILKYEMTSDLQLNWTKYGN